MAKIKCKKCGHVNSGLPNGRCTECGDYLYKYYVAKRNRATIITVAITILIFVGVYFGWKPIATLIRGDEVKEALQSYLLQIEKVSEKLKTTQAQKNYTRYVEKNVGAPDDLRILLSAFIDASDNKQLVNPYKNKDSSDNTPQYAILIKKLKAELPQKTILEMATAKGKDFEKLNQPLKIGQKIYQETMLSDPPYLNEKLSIRVEYYGLVCNELSVVELVNPIIQKIHSDIVDFYCSLYNAYSFLNEGIKKGVIVDVKEDEDEANLVWTTLDKDPSYSYKYDAQMSLAKDAGSKYSAVLLDLVKKKELQSLYDKVVPHSQLNLQMDDQ